MPETVSSQQPTPPAMLSKVRTVGQELREALGALIEDVPGGERGPTPLARKLGINRVMVSKLLNALRRDDVLEMLQHVPGPDSLRGICAGAERLGVEEDITLRATRAIGRFGDLIRDDFGTRGALNAAISASSVGLRKRYEEASRYDVYNGMRHVLGVEAETWLTCMVFAPNPEDEDAISVTTLHGAIAMHRLHADTPVSFSFGPPYVAEGETPDPLASPVALSEFYANEPASLNSTLMNGQLVHRLAPGALGKDAVFDMLAVAHDAKGSHRYATDKRVLAGAAIYPDIPVKVLHCDALVHRDIFPGVAPELRVYNPGARGPANPNDPTRDIDRIESDDRVVAIAGDSEEDRYSVQGVPSYRWMLRRVFENIGQGLEDYRIHRVRIAYPVHGFQYVIAFRAPQKG